MTLRDRLRRRAHKRARDRRLIRAMRRHGIVYPKTTLRVARRVNREHGHMPLSRACALLEQESSGGHNVFGSDPSIFAGAGQVTRFKYLAYKTARGHTRMQGVGPLQLTWWAFQDEADRRGGCWRPNVNIYVGLSHAAMQIAAHRSTHAGIAAYNGAGPAAETYSRTVQRREGRWHHVLQEATR